MCTTSVPTIHCDKIAVNDIVSPICSNHISSEREELA